MKTKDANIRVLLYQRRMTQTKLANKTHITRNTISAICNGKSCRYETAAKIAEALEVPLGEIVHL